jgi:predicted transcriptional regulator
MKKKLSQQNNLILYQASNGSIEFRGDFSQETIWATQAQIAEVFGVTSQNVTMHIRNIYREGELEESATCKKFLQVQIEGNRSVKRQIKEYNLDVIIAVGYRINSVVGTQFRKWATKTIREYLTKGFVLNKKQIKKNHQEFLKAIESIQNILPEHVTLDPKTILELVKEFASTWQSLDAYDKESLQSIGSTKKSVNISAGELRESIATLRADLMKKGEVKELFAQERRSGSIEGIVGNIMQSFGGKSVYPSIEEKAAHLLYFMVKDHPFSDGNKRSGAWSFIWFLRKTKAKGFVNINPGALTAITLLIAESKPDKKDQMIALVTTILSTKK